MQIIYKYMAEGDTINLPIKSQVLHIDIQRERICVWAVVNSEERISVPRYVVVCTGYKLPPEAGKHVKTFLLNNGSLVLHVFEYEL